MPKQKSQQINFKKLEVVADEFTGNVNGKVSTAAVTAVAAVAAANATDLASAQTLANELKTKFNALLAALKV
jgi:hypothetical protein